MILMRIFRSCTAVKPCLHVINIMTNFHENIDLYVGLLLILCSVAIFVFPPKFGNVFYGITTKWTMKNGSVWAAGQRLFAISISLMGIIFMIIGSLKIREQIPAFIMVLLLIGLWNSSKYIVHKALAKRYPNI